MFNGGSYNGKISPEMQRRIADFMRPHNQQLFELLGETWGWER